MKRWLPWLIYTSGAAAVIAIAFAAILAWVWRDAPPASDLPWPVADTDATSITETAAETGVAVTATWLGITTLLFDDGETQIMVDGTFTRAGPSALALGRLRSDIATINYAMDEFRIDRLAAIVPVHSHFDHAMDAGNVANRSNAVILGSESTANIARGAGVPVDQYQILASGETRHFGDFSITLVESAHAPLGHGEDGWLDGVIDEPLVQPARVWSWRGGAVTSVIIAHPSGTSLIQGSAGFVDDALAGVDADVVFLSVAGLASLGAGHTADYWRETVDETDAKRVLIVHFDDFTQPLGETRLFPSIADNVLDAAAWIDDLAAESGATVHRPPFGVPVPLY